MYQELSDIDRPENHLRRVGGRYRPFIFDARRTDRYVVDKEKLNRIELYGPLMDWHQRWATEVRTMYHVNCYRSNLLRLLHEAETNIRQALANAQTSSMSMMVHENGEVAGQRRHSDV